MTNYSKTNIYRRQMQQLGLDTKQYSQLIEMPYEVVKDFIYDKEGDYNMDIKNILRKNMLAKHQEIENNFEDSKFKAMEIKQQDEQVVDYFKWYRDVYDLETLKRKLKLSTVISIENNYDILVNGKKASHWLYVMLLGKKEYERHYIDLDKKLQFITQLYDIMENNNSSKYVTKKPTLESKNKVMTIKEKEKILLWYKSFNFEKYMVDNNISKGMLAQKSKISPTTLFYLLNEQKDRVSVTQPMIRMYDYIHEEESKNQKPKKETKDIEIISEEQDDNNTTTLYERNNNNEEIEFLDINDTPLNNLTSDKVDISTSQIEIEHDNNAILRMILVNRLTDEEKLLIELFGGKIC